MAGKRQLSWQKFGVCTSDLTFSGALSRVRGFSVLGGLDLLCFAVRRASAAQVERTVLRFTVCSALLASQFPHLICLLLRMCSREFFCELYTFFFFPFSLLPQSSETESLTTLDRLVWHPFLCTNECVSERQNTWCGFC